MPGPIFLSQSSPGGGSSVAVKVTGGLPRGHRINCYRSSMNPLTMRPRGKCPSNIASGDSPCNYCTEGYFG